MTKRISVHDHPLWDRARKKRTLLNLSLELTVRCNNNCIHCFNNLPENDSRAIQNELSTGRIKEIVDQAVDLGALWVTLTGGEILLRKDFAEIYTYIQKKGCLISVLTNATLINQEHVRLFKRYPPRDMEISVYGACEKNYARVTRARNFNKFLSGLETLSSASIPFTLKTMIMKSNLDYFKEIAKFCRKRTKKRFRFDPFLILRTDKNQERNKDILKERLSVDEILELERQDPERFQELRNKCKIIENDPAGGIPSEQIFKCGAGLNSSFVDASGIFRLCHSLVNGGCTYDLSKGSLRDAWEIFVPQILSLTSKKKSYRDTCGNCRMISLCMWCPAICDLEVGKLDEKIDSFCDLSESRYISCRGND